MAPVLSWCCYFHHSWKDVSRAFSNLAWLGMTGCTRCFMDAAVLPNTVVLAKLMQPSKPDMAYFLLSNNITKLSWYKKLKIFSNLNIMIWFLSNSGDISSFLNVIKPAFPQRSKPDLRAHWNVGQSHRATSIFENDLLWSVWETASVFGHWVERCWKSSRRSGRSRGLIHQRSADGFGFFLRAASLSFNANFPPLRVLLQLNTGRLIEMMTP